MGPVLDQSGRQERGTPLSVDAQSIMEMHRGGSKTPKRQSAKSGVQTRDTGEDTSPCSFFFFNFIFKLYIIVLVLPNIKMNPPQVYMCSPS